MLILCGNANKLGDASRSPGKSFLFFLTSFLQIDLGIGLPGDEVTCWGEQCDFVLSGALLTVLENPREMILASHLAVLITAAGLQGEQPLVDRIMQIREVGKLDP